MIVPTLKQAALDYLQHMEAHTPRGVHTHPVVGNETVAGCGPCFQYSLGMELRRAIERETGAPADWIDGSRAVRWGRWRWPTEPFVEMQRWGDSNGCRFILVSERNEGHSELPYDLFLYVAPKPNRRETGLCAHSVANRDRGLARFDAWLEGFLAGRGLLFPGENVR